MRVLERVLAPGPLLVGRVGRDPQALGGEAGPGHCGRAREPQDGLRVGGLQLERHGVTCTGLRA